MGAHKCARYPKFFGVIRGRNGNVTGRKWDVWSALEGFVCLRFLVSMVITKPTSCLDSGFSWAFGNN